MGSELPGGAASVYPANSAYAGMGRASPTFRAQRYHSYDSAPDTFLGYYGRHPPCR
ncbi:hypothetical protein ACVW1A_004568 [Bradyrhizobium sp. LB1.3]